MIGRLKNANATFYPKHLFYHPKWIVLGVNNICNLHCKMCDVGTGNNDTTFAQNLIGTSPMNMPLDLIKTIIDQTATYFPHARLGYAFTEPLIYPHLIESLEYAKSKDLYTTVTTNALTLKQKAEQLVDAGLGELFISLDGTAEVHNQIRGSSKSFERAVEGIDRLRSRDKALPITLIYAITEWNIDCMVPFLDFFSNYAINNVSFMHTQFTDPTVAQTHNTKFGELYKATVSNTQELDFSQIDTRKLLSAIGYIRQQSYPFTVNFSPDLHTAQEVDAYYFQPARIFGKRCHDVFNNMMIKSDGSIIPSHGRCYNVTVGNIYENNLKSIWNSAVFGKLRADILQAGGYFDACSRCCSGFNGYESKK